MKDINPDDLTPLERGALVAELESLARKHPEFIGLLALMKTMHETFDLPVQEPGPWEREGILENLFRRNGHMKPEPWRGE